MTRVSNYKISIEAVIVSKDEINATEDLINSLKADLEDAEFQRDMILFALKENFEIDIEEVRRLLNIGCFNGFRFIKEDSKKSVLEIKSNEVSK